MRRAPRWHTWRLVSGSTQVRCALGALLVAVMLVPVAGAGAASDRDAVLKDYSSGRNITACAFTLGQLENVLSQLGPDANVYAPGLNDAISARSSAGRTASARARRAPRSDIRIVKIKSKGGGALGVGHAEATSAPRTSACAATSCATPPSTRSASRRRRSRPAARSSSSPAVARARRPPCARARATTAVARRSSGTTPATPSTLVNDKGTLLSAKTYGTPPS